VNSNYLATELYFYWRNNGVLINLLDHREELTDYYARNLSVSTQKDYLEVFVCGCDCNQGGLIRLEEQAMLSDQRRTYLSGVNF